MCKYENWLLTEEDHIATLTLNRPEQKNSISAAVLSELRTITAELAERTDVWGVVLQGQGDHFSAGADLALFQRLLEQPTAVFR